MNTIFTMTPLDDKCRNLQVSPTHFSASSYSFRYINILIFYLQKVGQGHGVQFWQLQRSMANVRIYKLLPAILALALTVSEI